MVIYRSIMFEGKVFVVSRELSIQKLNCILNTFKEMLKPLNFSE